MTARHKIFNNKSYHLYNKGVEKSKIFLDDEDFSYFIKLLQFFNTKKALGRFHRYEKIDKIFITEEDKKPLVEIISYCLNEDHYHLILHQINDFGISKFMQKIITAYTMYFNKKYNRTGPLFVGRFKSKFIDGKSSLEYLSVYVNLNYVVHKPKLESFRLYISPGEKQKYVSSWDEYLDKTKRKICRKSHVMDNFRSKEHYRRFAGDKLTEILKNRKREIEI